MESFTWLTRARTCVVVATDLKEEVFLELCISRETLDLVSLYGHTLILK